MKPDELKAALAKIGKLKDELAKKRDELREAVSEVNEILETLDQGIEEMEIGKKYFDDALDEMSQLI